MEEFLRIAFCLAGLVHLDLIPFKYDELGNRLGTRDEWFADDFLVRWVDYQNFVNKFHLVQCPNPAKWMTAQLNEEERLEKKKQPWKGEIDGVRQAGPIMEWDFLMGLEWKQGQGERYPREFSSKATQNRIRKLLRSIKKPSEPAEVIDLTNDNSIPNPAIVRFMDLTDKDPLPRPASSGSFNTGSFNNPIDLVKFSSATANTSKRLMRTPKKATVGGNRNKNTGLVFNSSLVASGSGSSRDNIQHHPRSVSSPTTPPPKSGEKQNQFNFHEASFMTPAPTLYNSPPYTSNDGSQRQKQRSVDCQPNPPHDTSPTTPTPKSRGKHGNTFPPTPMATPRSKSNTANIPRSQRIAIEDALHQAQIQIIMNGMIPKDIGKRRKQPGEPLSDSDDDYDDSDDSEEDESESANERRERRAFNKSITRNLEIGGIRDNTSTPFLSKHGDNKPKAIAPQVVSILGKRPIVSDQRDEEEDPLILPDTKHKRQRL